MGRHTAYTRRWLDRRFRQRTDDGLYHAHQPIYGIGHPASEPGHPRRIARTLQIMRVLARLDFETMLDVGGGEGYIAACAQRILGCRAVSCDLSLEACKRAYDLFELDSAAVTSYALPFPDDAFDVVVCSEVLEHVEHPIETLAELERVARVAVVLTTEECELDRDAIERHLFERCGFPHFERNVFHPDDLRALFGQGVDLRSQITRSDPPNPATADAVRAWALEVTTADRMVADGIGVVMVAARSGTFDRKRKPRADDDEILDVVCAPLVPPRPLTHRTRTTQLSGLLARAVCPDCRGALDESPLRCRACATEFDVSDGTADLTARADPDRATTETALLARWGQRRGAAALALSDRLDLPMTHACRRWEFTRVEDRRGWMPNADLESVERVGPGWHWRSSQTPWLVGPGIGLRGDRIAAAELTMRIHNPAFDRNAGVGQLWWLTEDDTDFGPDRHLVFPIVNDGEVHTYRLELGTDSRWNKDRDIVCLRLDPVNGPCAIELLAFELIAS